MTIEIADEHFTVDPKSKAQQNLLVSGLTASEAILECLACGAAWRGYVVAPVVNSKGYIVSGQFYPTLQLLKGDEG